MTDLALSRPMKMSLPTLLSDRTGCAKGTCISHVKYLSKQEGTD